MSMHIIEVDMMDGKSPIQVAVANDSDADRFRTFLQDAAESIVACEASEESLYYAELNRGYAKDRM